MANQKQFQTMVALVGEQPMPNLLPAREYGVKKVCLLFTTKTKNTAKNLKHVLENAQIEVDLKEVDAYNIPEILAVLEREYLNWSEPVMFNVTGGTKAMSFAVLEQARAIQSDFCYLEMGAQLYHYTWKNGVPILFEAPKTMQATMTLEDFLNSKQGENWERRPHAKATKGYGFEKALADAIESMVDELMHSVFLMNGQVEVDILFRKGHVIGAVEAKDSKEYNKGVRHLHTAGQQLGLSVKKFLVTTQINANPEHLEPWQQTGVRFVKLAYPNDVLSADDLETLRKAIND